VNEPKPREFWTEAFTLQGSITPIVVADVIGIGVMAAIVVGVVHVIETRTGSNLRLEVAPWEIAGAALSLLLILRTNAGYDRWWEARKLWGGIVNQCRNLAVDALAYGPADAGWRREFLSWIAAYPHVVRCSLRGESPPDCVSQLVGDTAARQLADSAHRPSFVALRLADMLREACDRQQLDRFAFLQLDRERALLIDHVGACERILKTPLPLAYSIKIRRYIALFLCLLPFALLDRLHNDWIVPPICMLVAYPLFSLDQMGIELQNPFSKKNLSHLPLEDISETIERNVMGLLKERSIVGSP
jgi:putative membrane protein